MCYNVGKVWRNSKGFERENRPYWYYYKWNDIAGVCVIGLVILFLVQVVFKTKWQIIL